MAWSTQEVDKWERPLAQFRTFFYEDTAWDEKNRSSETFQIKEEDLEKIEDKFW